VRAQSSHFCGFFLVCHVCSMFVKGQRHGFGRLDFVEDKREGNGRMAVSVARAALSGAALDAVTTVNG